MAMLEIKNLEVYYGVIQALKGISFEQRDRSFLKGRTLRRCRDIRSCPWEWRMCRRAGECSRILRCLKI